MKDLASIPLPQLESARRKGPEPVIEWMRASDGVQLACRIWRGKVGNPVVVYLHGVEGHGQWFENTADVLQSRGITVYAPDRRGAGLNSRDRGHLPSYKLFIDDINGLLRRVSSQHAGHAIVLWGNCWGAKAACLFAQDQGGKSASNGQAGTVESFPIAALVLTSPAIFSKIDFDFKTKMEIAINHFMGDRRAMRKIPVPIAPSMFTDNPVYLDYIEKDPLRLTEFTSTFYIESHKLSRLAEKTASRITKPVMILQPGADEIVDIPKLQAWHNKVKAAEKSLRIFPDAYHSLDFDATWFKEYTHLVSEWLLARSPVVS